MFLTPYDIQRVVSESGERVYILPDGTKLNYRSPSSILSKIYPFVKDTWIASIANKINNENPDLEQAERITKYITSVSAAVGTYQTTLLEEDLTGYNLIHKKWEGLDPIVFKSSAEFQELAGQHYDKKIKIDMPPHDFIQLTAHKCAFKIMEHPTYKRLKSTNTFPEAFLYGNFSHIKLPGILGFSDLVSIQGTEFEIWDWKVSKSSNLKDPKFNKYFDQLVIYAMLVKSLYPNLSLSGVGNLVAFFNKEEPEVKEFYYSRDEVTSRIPALISKIGRT